MFNNKFVLMFLSFLVKFINSSTLPFVFLLRFILKLLVLSCVTSTYGTDYYEMLSVSKAATTQEIRKAFKRKAITLHPDKNQVGFCILIETLLKRNSPVILFI